MSYSIKTVHVIKNEKGQYFTGNTRYSDEDKWDTNFKKAKQYDHISHISVEIIDDRKQIEEYEGFDFFPDEVYTIKTKIIIKDLND